MKIRLITVGKPRLDYALLGWSEYINRLSRMHQVTVVNVPDKHAYDINKIMKSQQATYRVVLDVDGRQFTSHELANRLEKMEVSSKEVSFLVGGPNGLPDEVRQAADLRWSLGRLTLPHDLAMVNLAEALYRASAINANLPYHK